MAIRFQSYLSQYRVDTELNFLKGRFYVHLFSPCLELHDFNLHNIFVVKIKRNFLILLHFLGAAVAEWLSSWLAEQEDRGSIPGLATWIFRDWLSPASKSRYGWKIAKSTLILKTTNQPTIAFSTFLWPGLQWFIFWYSLLTLFVCLFGFFLI